LVAVGGETNTDRGEGESCGAAVVTLYLTTCLVFGYISLILLIESRGTLLEGDYLPVDKYGNYPLVK
jgi:hypothetical protein